MAKWRKTPPEMEEALAEAMRPYPAQPRKMFGFSTWFVNGNMFAGTFEDAVILRLAEKDREALLAAEDEVGVFTPMEGRPMKEYLLIPEPLFSDRAWFAPHLARSFRYASSLPPKRSPKRKK